MKHQPLSVALAVTILLVMLAIAACSLPGLAPSNPPVQYQATVQAAAAQTLAAQGGAPLGSQIPATGATLTPNIAATINALATANRATVAAATQQGGAGQGALATQAIAATQAAAQATGAAYSNQATAMALAAQATAQAGSAAQATAMAQSAQATAWSWAATATALAFPPPPPPAGRIRFAQGATAATVDGRLGSGTAADYLLDAGANQTMLANVYSPNNDVYLGVTTPDGVPLMRPAAGQTGFTGQLPAGGDYRLTVAAPQENSNYTLQVIIPARIQFAPGAVSARIPGYLAGGQVNYYLAWAKAGQRMTVNILSPHNDIFLTIYGLQDGSPLVRSVMGQSSWSDVLNLSQDYMIQAVSTGGNANYTIEISIQ